MNDTVFKLFSDLESRIEVVSRDFLPCEILDAASLDQDPRVRRAAAAHPFASRWLIEHCLNDPDQNVREAAANNPGYFSEVLFTKLPPRNFPTPPTIKLVEEIGQQIKEDVFSFISGEGISVGNAFEAAVHTFKSSDGQTDWSEVQNFLACSLANQVADVVARHLGDKDEFPNFFRQMDRLGFSVLNSLRFAERILMMPDEQIIRGVSVAFINQNHFAILDMVAFEGKWGVERTACAVAKSAVFLSINWPVLRRWLMMRLGKRHLVNNVLNTAQAFVRKRIEYPSIVSDFKRRLDPGLG